MKSLKDLKDNDGISLKAYTDILVNKCRDANVAVVILIAELDPTAPMTYMATNLPKTQVPDAIRQFANIVDGQPSNQSQITLTDADPS